MTENTNEETTVNEDKKDFARRWGIVGLGVALTTALVMKAFSDGALEDDSVEIESEYDEDGNLTAFTVTDTETKEV